MSRFAVLLRILAAHIGFGTLAAVVWWQWAPTAPVQVSGASEYALTDPELFIGQEGRFMVVTGIGGIITALMVCWRSERAAMTRVIAGLLGALGASLLCWYLGAMLGPPAITDELRDRQEVVQAPLMLQSWQSVLTWPGIAASGCAMYLSVRDWSDSTTRR